MHDRTHSVKIDNHVRSTVQFLWSTPGLNTWANPINIFINDIPKIDSLPEITTSTTIYADDVQLLFSGTPNNLEQLKIYAETGLKTMKEWYSENGLKMNSNKTQCILFATPNFNKRTETFQITIDDTVRMWHMPHGIHSHILYFPTFINNSIFFIFYLAYTCIVL